MNWYGRNRTLTLSQDRRSRWIHAITLFRIGDGESFQHKDTWVPSEPRYDLRKRTNSNEQKEILLIQKFEKLSFHEMNDENLSKKTSPRGFIFCHFPLNV